MKTIKKDKRAWLRIFEAFVAILLIASVLLILYSRQGYKLDKDDEIKKIERAILEEIERNDSLRQEAITSPEINNNETFKEYQVPAGIEDVVLARVPASLQYEIKICSPDSICGLSEYVKTDVYADEVIVSSTLQVYGPRKLKLFLWTR